MSKKIMSFILPTILSSLILPIQSADVSLPIPLKKSVHGYNLDNLYDSELYTEFDVYDIEKREDGFIVQVYQTYSPEEIWELSSKDLQVSSDKTVTHKITYTSYDNMVKIDSSIVGYEEPVFESLTGIVCRNNEKEQQDILLCFDDGNTRFISDFIEGSQLYSRSILDDFTHWFLSLITDAKEKVVKVMRFTLHIVCNVVGLENGALLLNMKTDDKGIYHADFNCWQQYAGYTDLYDFVFRLGSSMKAVKFEFYDEDEDGLKDYILWGWKGDYWELGAGAELGIYRRFKNSDFWYVDKRLAIDMAMMVRCDRVSYPIIEWNPKEDAKSLGWTEDEENSWWITGFNPKFANMNIDQTELSVDFMIEIDPIGFSEAFSRRLRQEFIDEWFLDVSHQHDTHWGYDYSIKRFTYNF